MKQNEQSENTNDGKKTTVELSAMIKLTKTCEKNGKEVSKDTGTLEVNLNLQSVEEVTKKIIRGAIMGAAEAASSMIDGDGAGEGHHGDDFEDPK